MTIAIRSICTRSLSLESKTITVKIRPRAKPTSPTRNNIHIRFPLEYHRHRCRYFKYLEAKLPLSSSLWHIAHLQRTASGQNTRVRGQPATVCDTSSDSDSSIRLSGLPPEAKRVLLAVGMVRTVEFDRTLHRGLWWPHHGLQSRVQGRWISSAESSTAEGSAADT